MNAVGLNNTVNSDHKPIVYILLVLALVYFPFVNKAFTVDDTLFIKAAVQILETPLDFYGGEVNWYGTSHPHHMVNKNPPLIAYLIALAASVSGFKETALHTFFFLPLAASAVGIFLLGRRFSTNPAMAAVLAVFTPVFLVHGTNVMSDTTLLMFWVWGMVFWFNGVESRSPAWFFLAGVSISLGMLTKYTGVFLLPLIFFSGIWQFRRPGWWVVAWLIPIFAISLYENHTRAIYGSGSFLEAMFFANYNASSNSAGWFDNTLIGLSFLGGCFPVALFLMPLVGGRMLRLAVSVLAMGIIAFAFFGGGIGDQSFVRDGAVNISLITHFAAFSLAGICLVAACLQEVRRGLSHDSIFLLLWFFGILFFACHMNWIINARSFILLVPVVGILLARRIEEWLAQREATGSAMTRALIGIAGLLAVAVTYADYKWANTARTAAGDITSQYKDAGKLWFQGHWGFQFYMEEQGAEPMDLTRDDIQPGEILIIPINNANLSQPGDDFVLEDVREYALGSMITTMRVRGAGFYVSFWSAVPYLVEMPRLEIYLIYRKTAQADSELSETASR